MRKIPARTTVSTNPDAITPLTVVIVYCLPQIALASISAIMTQQMTIAWVLAIIEPLGICALATMNHSIGMENNVFVREARAAFGAASAAAGSA